MRKLLNVTPIYGWGWMGSDHLIRETPSPFALRVTAEGPGLWRGIIETPGHEFDGLSAVLQQHYVKWEGTVSISINDDGLPGGWGRLTE